MSPSNDFTGKWHDFNYIIAVKSFRLMTYVGCFLKGASKANENKQKKKTKTKLKDNANAEPRKSRIHL